MPINTADVIAPPTGVLYVGVLGSATPTELYAAWPTGWKDLGLLTDEGFQFTPNDKETEEVRAWQLLDPVRRIVTGRNIVATATLQQYNRDTFDFAAGSGTWTNPQARQTWLASTAYTLNAVREPVTANGYVYKVTTAGTSAASAPTFPTAIGATVTDGTVVWTNIGQGSTVVYKFVPAAPEFQDLRMLGWEWSDGARKERGWLTQGINTGGEAITYTRTGPTTLQISFGIIGQAGVNPYEKIDNFSAVIP